MNNQLDDLSDVFQQTPPPIDKSTDTTKLRKQPRTLSPAIELLQKATACYTEAELQKLLGDFVPLSRSTETGNPEVIEYALDRLGFSTEARDIDESHTKALQESDETAWPQMEVCLWPNSLRKPDPRILLRIISGNHRTTVAREKDLKVFRMRVLKVETELDFRILAAYFNATHGKRFTDNEGKQQALYFAQEGMLQSVIAATLGVDKSTVSRWVSGKDSNASGKQAREKRDEALSLLSAAAKEMVDEEWASLPRTNLETKQLIETREALLSALRTFLTLDKTYVSALMRDLALDLVEKEKMCSKVDMGLRFLRNASALLSGGLVDER